MGWNEDGLILILDLGWVWFSASFPVEERTKTLETKNKEKCFGCDEESMMEESVKKRKWERKRRRGKKKCSANQRERTKE
jgi:hypothetical protein